MLTVVLKWLGPERLNAIRNTFGASKYFVFIFIANVVGIFVYAISKDGCAYRNAADFVINVSPDHEVVIFA